MLNGDISYYNILRAFNTQDSLAICNYLVLICARMICFAKTGLVGGVGVSGVRQVVCLPIAVARV